MEAKTIDGSFLTKICDPALDHSPQPGLWWFGTTQKYHFFDVAPYHIHVIMNDVKGRNSCGVCTYCSAFGIILPYFLPNKCITTYNIYHLDVQ